MRRGAVAEEPSGSTAKAAIVTGGASGIGRETARELLALNARVLIADRNATAIEVACRLFAPYAGRFQSVVIDATDRKDVDRMLDRALVAFGQGL